MNKHILKINLSKLYIHILVHINDNISSIYFLIIYPYWDNTLRILRITLKHAFILRRIYNEQTKKGYEGKISICLIFIKKLLIFQNVLSGYVSLLFTTSIKVNTFTLPRCKRRYWSKCMGILKIEHEKVINQLKQSSIKNCSLKMVCHYIWQRIPNFCDFLDFLFKPIGFSITQHRFHNGDATKKVNGFYYTLLTCLIRCIKNQRYNHHIC